MRKIAFAKERGLRWLRCWRGNILPLLDAVLESNIPAVLDATRSISWQSAGITGNA
jgi:hypothetical protein